MKGSSASDAHRLSEQTYEHLLSLIEAGDLKPGELLEERALAIRLSVSRTPIRAALSRLIGEGLVARMPGGLLMVTELGLEDYAQLIQFRRLLEAEAAFLAAGKIPPGELRSLITRIERAAAAPGVDLPLHWQLDDELHTLIAGSCANRWLGQSVATVRRMIRMCNVEKLPHRFHETCAEHLAILHALRDADGDRARDCMRRHIDQVRLAFVHLLSIR
jgi:DNA-binding GntR family transcriptional regulator